MKRLLSDAQKLSGVEYNIDNLGDVYEAIHVIQEELGVSGVAAEEASTTFTGSFAAMKAAAENLMANISLGQDLTTSLQTLQSTISAFLFNNLIPMLKNILSSLPSLLGGENGLVSIAMQLVQELINGITEALPGLITAGMDMLDSIITGIQNDLPNILDTIIDVLTNVLIQIAENLPEFVLKGADLILSIIEGLMQALPKILSSIVQIIGALISSIVQNLPQFMQQGIEMIGRLISGIWQMRGQILTTVLDLCKKMINAFLEVDWLDLGKNILEGIGKGITGAVGNLVNAAKNACSNVIGGVKNFFGIASPSKVMAKEVGRFLPSGIAVGIEDNIGSAEKAMANMSSILTGQVSSTFSGIEVGGSLASAVPSISINVYATERQNEKQIAEEVSQILNKQLLRSAF